MIPQSAPKRKRKIERNLKILQPYERKGPINSVEDVGPLTNDG